MKWKRNTGFDQIEDRRGQGGGGLGGALGGGGGGIPIPIPGGRTGGGIGGIIISIILFLLVSGVLGGGMPSLGGLGGGGAAQPGGTLDPQSDTDQQLAYIVNDIQTFWASTFKAAGRDYPETKLVLFEGGTSSSCGPASAATGPFYCPADQKVYLDLGFFDELRSRFGAQGGDFAMAYVVAHEFGHHVQNALGIAERVQQTSQQDPSQQNALSVRMELQADCLAGVWSHAAATDLQPGDIDEALSAASAVGDDRIQQSTSGRVDPESWTHGSAEQRVAWFTKGYQSGSSDDCDTFAQ
ncbi:MAG TPA: neutral zinc metallopeptidase [Candidatus Limnocylindrales bacterium]|jgi:predicted metalloprotease|nr:neutral zinc metallopeptidase [Candidatus Limnocylindrales bacterium]